MMRQQAISCGENKKDLNACFEYSEYIFSLHELLVMDDTRCDYILQEKFVLVYFSINRNIYRHFQKQSLHCCFCFSSDPFSNKLHRILDSVIDEVDELLEKRRWDRAPRHLYKFHNTTPSNHQLIILTLKVCLLVISLHLFNRKQPAYVCCSCMLGLTCIYTNMFS